MHDDTLPTSDQNKWVKLNEDLREALAKKIDQVPEMKGEEIKALADAVNQCQWTAFQAALWDVRTEVQKNRSTTFGWGD